MVAASADSIYGIIFGRALQGAGAIGAVIMALIADLTREEHRTKALAMFGMSIGMSFAVAIVLGPILNKWIGVPGIFWMISILAIMGVFILYFIVPTPIKTRFHRDTEPVPAQFKRILTDGQLVRLDLGIFCLHAQLTSLFLVLPLVLQQELEVMSHWKIYLGVLMLSVIIMVPFIIISEKKQRLKQTLIGAISLLFLAELGLLLWHDNLINIIIMLILFFTAFNLLEASLPSLISKTAPADAKGTAMGVYSTSQFLGIFVGGLCAGWLHQYYGMYAVFSLGIILSFFWLILAITMQQPSYFASHMLNIGKVTKTQANDLIKKLNSIAGVKEVTIIIEDEVAYLKIDKNKTDLSVFDEFSV
jgi:predicted MFS family arabinose efflux permease